MQKMAAQIETIVTTYKTLSRVSVVTGGRLNKAGNRVTANWSVRNLDKGKRTKYSTNFTLNDNLSIATQGEFGADISTELLTAISPRETYKAIIREENTSKDAKKQYLEVWSQSTLAHCIDLTALDVHGDVYADSEFGTLDWNEEETKIVYIAERKLAKLEPYIKRKPEPKPKCDGCSAGDSAPTKGEEFVYRQDWGEQLVGKSSSVIVICTLRDESLTILDHLPSGCCPGQVRFSPEGGSLVGVAWPTEPRRLGLIFCTNRPSFIFSLTPDGTLTKLSAEGKAVRSPRYSQRGDLVWMQRAADGPHHAGHQIVIKKHGSEDVVPLVDLVETEKPTSSGLPFFGVYSQALPRNCFSKDGGRLVFCTPQQTEVRSYVVDIETGVITDISIKTAPGSTTILDVQNDVILATFSNLTTPGQVYIARLPPTGSEASISWQQVSAAGDPSPAASAHVEYLQLAHEGADGINSFSAIYFSPAAKEGKRHPLIVWPHGGPHSGFVNSYALETTLFHLLGFATLQINYRGSSGAGEASLRFLPGKAGDADVKDCKLATDVALTKFPIDEKKLLLFGGSHGGFLVTHLSGQYPDVYRAVVSRNPVIDIATMFNYTDISDWLGFLFTHLSGQYPDIAKRLLAEIRKNPVVDVATKFTTHTSIIGFALLRVNYRGSTGAGDDNVRSLIAHVGDYDVADCCLALTTAMERDSTSHVLLNGGSYGGLVVAHMAARYPDLFTAVVMRNPLIDLATKGHCADNSDGCAVEAGFEYTERGPLSEEELLIMRRCSPMAHVHKVRAPTAMMLGSGDKRVPYFQGLDYARRLQANGVETRVYMYDDNHSLSKQPAEMDNLINSARWFLTHIDQ